MCNSVNKAKLEHVIAFLQSEGVFADTLDFTPEQYDSLRRNIKVIVPDINIELIDKNGVIRCHIQSESLDIRACSNSGGRTGRTNNEYRAFRRFCKAVYENYGKSATQETTISNAPVIIFELKHCNWGLSGPGDWSSDNWVLYDNNWVEKKRFYRDERGDGVRLFESNSARFSKEKTETLVELINTARTIDKHVDACDGDAWEFAYYKNNEVIWKREIGYIYGIEPLERITKLFELEPIKIRPKERFGEKPIPDKIKDVYQQATMKMFGNVTLLTSDEISALKGMCNRCIKHDQSDWRTTYSMIGSPERTILKSYVDEIVSIRDDVRLGNYSNVIAFRDKYYDIFKNTYEELCGDLTEEYVNVSNADTDAQIEITNLEQYTSVEEYDSEINTIESPSIDVNLSKQINEIENFVRCYPPDKNDGRYSRRCCKRIIHSMIEHGIIPNLAFGQRGKEYIAWIPGINLIGTSENDNRDAVDSLGRKLVVEVRRQGLKPFVNTNGQYSSVLFGEDATKLQPEKKYDAIIEVILEATSQGANFAAGRCASALRRLYDLKLVTSPVEHFSRNKSFISKIPGINVEGVTNVSGSEIHRQNAADKELVQEILAHHNKGILKNLIDSALLSSPYEVIDEDWLLSYDDEPEKMNCNIDVSAPPNDTNKEELNNTILKPTINITVNLSQLDFSFEEKDDDDDLNF